MVSAVFWSGLAGWIMLRALVPMLPGMEEAARQGWNVFFRGMDAQVKPAIRTLLHLAVFVSQRLRGLARARRSATRSPSDRWRSRRPGGRSANRADIVRRSRVELIFRAVFRLEVR
ncbi:hypothetical protein [uncultured Amaricoccus sp.]|uniref:hypothetical protein n=1 Tax=uncultured Amaricoccus sp. TaxID=339341 RepID=UPI0026362F22|nr:hypothetical protein [uncultured Amaricoccus sp.]